MSDFFPRYTMKPNPQCDNRFCVSSQEDHQKWLEAHKGDKKEVKEEKKIVHEENEWGICVVEGSGEEETLSDAPEGSHYEFERPSNETIADEDLVKVDDTDDLDSLMGQLASLN